MTSRLSRLGRLALLSVSAAVCSRPPKVLDYAVQTNCGGGGGVYKCTAKNPTPNKYGPFKLEFEFVGDRGGAPIGRATVENNEGLDPQGEWEFDLTRPARTRSVRLTRVVPR